MFAQLRDGRDRGDTINCMSATLCRLTGNRDIHWKISNWAFQIGRKKWKKSPRDKKKFEAPTGSLN